MITNPNLNIGNLNLKINTIKYFNRRRLYCSTSRKKIKGKRFGILIMNFLVVLLFAVVWGQKVRFDGYKVHRLKPTNASQIEIIRDLEFRGEYDFWSHLGGVDGSVDILVPPKKSDEFESFVEENEIPSICQIEDVQRLIDEEALQSRCIDMDWKGYHRLQQIDEWVDETAKKSPYATKVIVGKSHEGRRIKGLEISFKQNTTGVFLEAGIYGREWISPAATTWMIDQILESPEDSVFRNFTFFYIPVVNPDGYEYSWTHNRLWKKTRTPYRVAGKTCYGADPNKNWGFRWNEVGASDDPCSENYAGPWAFSEVEIKSVSSYLNCIARARNVDIYIAYQGYSQVLTYPWDDEETPAPHAEIWERIAEAAVGDLEEVHGTIFRVRNSSENFYPTGGVSRDWYYDRYNATITFTYSLRDTGHYGFLLPPDQIIPSGEELLFSLERVLDEYLQLNFTDVDLGS